MYLISIILPTYNSISYLQERVDTILCQTYTNWECVVIDGESTDGTWEYLTEISKKDDRFKTYQFEPKGVYNAWNKGVKLAVGNFIYFATSDDTMTKDCLEKMVLALENNPNCSIAHCCLKIINERSERESTLDWYRFPAQQYFKEKTHEHHIRKAPLCGMLYLTHQTIIHSFTQILIRKRVFDNIGLFLEDQGPEADLEWGMRAALSEHIVHVPHELATWRVHAEQLTNFKPAVPEMKHILSLQIIAIKNAKIEDVLKRKMLANTRLFQVFSLQQLFRELTVIQKIKSFSFWKMKLLFYFHSEIKGILNRRNDYFEFIIKKLFNKSGNKFIIEKAEE